MRVFVAIDIPGEIRQRLSAMQDQLRQVSTSAKWVDPESIHLTLRFIGEISDKRVEDIHTALLGLTWKPCSVTVRGVGFFPGTRSPRVFWAGLECSTLEGLAREIDSRLDRAGFDSEERAFRPHLTLARTKDRPLESALVQAAGPFEKMEVGKFVADRFFLYQSTLKPRGAVHTKLKEYTL
jgi:2'-5' RNA ligase